MKHLGNRVEELKIAYIGGGSRGWAWGLMSDLVSVEDIGGSVALYDIDREAAAANQRIGMRYNDAEGAKSHWDYSTADTLEDALTGADFVVISILPGTFKEMESDVHTPEKYGIYQSVGDTVGPGGIVRALRTIPMMQTIAEGIKKCCPGAWVLNYTNPMTVCMRTLYKVFPQIRAFGCCHEVFGTQRLLAEAVADICGVSKPLRQEIQVNVIGVNHYTWLTAARYQDMDVMPVYRRFCEKYHASGYTKDKDDNWMNNSFACSHRVKMDLFLRYGLIAAAGDRHLAEFNNGKRYLESPEKVRQWGFGLTTVKWRWDDLARRLERSRRKLSGEEPVKLANTGELGVQQIRALLGLRELVTNVNLPNRGQIPNLPMDAVVETNAVFRAGMLEPVFAGNIPAGIHGQIAAIVSEQETVVEAGLARDLEKAFTAFLNDPLVTVGMEDARKLFNEMVENTKDYLQDYLR